MGLLPDILLVLAVLFIVAAGWRVILMERRALEDARASEAIIAALQIDIRQRDRELARQSKLLASANAWMMLAQARLTATGKGSEPAPDATPP